MGIITKTFYISDGDLRDIRNEIHLDECEDIILSSTNEAPYKNEIQVTWREADKKIEVTESQYDLYVEEAIDEASKTGARVSQILKRKLFEEL